MVARSPRELRVPGERSGYYRLAADLTARHGVGAGGFRQDGAGNPGDAHANADDPGAVLAFPGQGISVERSSSLAEGHGEGTIGPVYRREPGGGVAVPTGRALVRFAEGEAAAERGDELAAAGYKLEGVPRYAPHAAWVRASGGGIAETLQNLDRLERLPGVENVEPQMISRAEPRILP